MILTSLRILRICPITRPLFPTCNLFKGLRRGGAIRVFGAKKVFTTGLGRAFSGILGACQAGGWNENGLLFFFLPPLCLLNELPVYTRQSAPVAVLGLVMLA
jgi:hypothetical protein